MVDPGKQSATKITTYMGCSFAYYLKYVAKEKVPSNSRLMFGKRIHYMLENFYDVNFKSPESFGRFWKHDWYSNISGEYLKGKGKENLIITEHEYYVKNPETGKKERKILPVGNHVDLGENPVGAFFGFMKLGVGILEDFYKKHKNLAPPEKTEFSFGKKKLEP